MRAPAQVGEVALRIEGNRLVVRDGTDDLRLVVLTLALEEFHGFVAIPDLALDFDIAFRNFRHALLDRGKILGRERTFIGKIVVEPVLDHRADGDLGVRVEFLHGVGEQVGGRVAQDIDAVRVLVGHHGKVGVMIDDKRRIDQLAIDPSGQCGARQPRTDRRGNLGNGDSMVEGLERSVGQSDGGHFSKIQNKKVRRTALFRYRTEKGFRSDALNPACKFGDPFLSFGKLVGANGLEPSTPTMSRWCSNQLSYAPVGGRILNETPPAFKPHFLRADVTPAISRTDANIRVSCGNPSTSSVNAIFAFRSWL